MGKLKFSIFSSVPGKQSPRQDFSRVIGTGSQKKIKKFQEIIFSKISNINVVPFVVNHWSIKSRKKVCYVLCNLNFENIKEKNNRKKYGKLNKKNIFDLFNYDMKISGKQADNLFDFVWYSRKKPHFELISYFYKFIFIIF